MDSLDVTLTTLLGELAYAALKATAIVVGAAGVAHCMRRRSAAERHLVWGIGLGGAIAVLMIPAILPAWHVIPLPLRLREGPGISAASPSTIEQRFGEDSGTASQQVPEEVFSSVENQPPVASSTTGTLAADGRWPLFAGSLWMAGTLFVIARHLQSRHGFRSVLQRASAAREGRWVELVAETGRAWKMTRRVTLLISDDLDFPATYGIRKPYIVLPREAEEWSESCCRHALHHELTHVKRLDACTQLVARVASAIFWFHPLLWHAVRQMRYEQERACDDYVLAAGALASDYAKNLLTLARRCGDGGKHPVALAMASSQVEARLLALLDPNTRRGVLSIRSIVFGMLVAIFLVIPLAAARGAMAAPAQTIVAQQSEKPPSSAEVDVAASRAGTARRSVASAFVRATPVHVDIFAGCGSNNSVHDSQHSGDGSTRWKSSGIVGACSFELNAEGAITFDPDLTTVERITPGGFIEMTTDIRVEVTRLVAGPSSSGTVTSTVTRNGMPLKVPGEGAAWLAAFLLSLDRRIAFAVDSRFPRLLQDGGSRGVLDEVSQMYAHHAKGEYLMRLLDQAMLSPEDLHRIFELAASLGSGHEASRVLLSAVERFDLQDNEARAAFLRTALALSPDSNRGQVLLAFLRRTSPTHEEAASIVASVTGMGADSEKSRILIAIAGKESPDGNILDAYLKSAETIHSIYIRRRVLAAIGQ